MSFSGDVKRELAGRIGKSRHCQIAELAVLMAFDQKIASSEPSLVREKYGALCSRVLDAGDAAATGTGQKLYEAVKMWDAEAQRPAVRDTISGMLIQQACCKRAFIRGAFLSAGSISDPQKSYHFEIVCGSESQAVQVQETINSFGLDSKIVERKNHRVVYLKEGAQIVDILNVMEAHTSLMNLENVRILKEMRNSVNRKVNCETANITKTVGAAVKQIEDINYIRAHMGLDGLPDNLKEMALLRLQYPDTPLKELGTYLNPSVGKSGVNHRLRRISEIAEKLREQA